MSERGAEAILKSRRQGETPKAAARRFREHSGQSTATSKGQNINGPRGTSPPTPRAGGRSSGGRASQGGKAIGQVAGRTAVAPLEAGNPKHYRGILIAEYLASMIMVGTTPFFAPDSAASPQQTGTHSRVMLRLTAVTMLFMILGFLSNSPNSGKLAAAFGGLVTLGIGIHSTVELNWIATHIGVSE